MGVVVGESWTEGDEQILDIIEVTTSIIRGRVIGKDPKDPDVGIDHDFSDDEKEWRQHALCRGLDGNIFFPERGHSMLPAYAVCRGCPVRMECLESAVTSGKDKWGIRGGFTPEERKKIYKRVREEEVSFEEASEFYDEKRHKRLTRALARVGINGARALHREPVEVWDG